MHRKSPNYNRSLVILKPDAVQRGLVGEILKRFEQKGLQLSAMKMVWPDQEQGAAHYFWTEEEKLANGNRTLKIYEEKGIKLDKTPIELAEATIAKLVRFMTTGPVVVMVIEGLHAIEWIRKMVGHGSPLNADVGTIRADFGIDSYPFADEVDRVTRNLIHASSSVDEAEREIKVWFTEEEVFDYETSVEKVLYSGEWEEDDQEALKKRIQR